MKNFKMKNSRIGVFVGIFVSQLLFISKIVITKVSFNKNWRMHLVSVWHCLRLLSVPWIFVSTWNDVYIQPACSFVFLCVYLSPNGYWNSLLSILHTLFDVIIKKKGTIVFIQKTKFAIRGWEIIHKNFVQF